MCLDFVSDLQLDVTLGHLKGLISFLQQHRENGFTSAIVTARELADGLGVPPTFKMKRNARKKRIFDYASNEEVN